ncbi:MAG: ABC transporter permease [bacterium]|nr:ABC transporter permease [bacterium]
MNAGRVTAVARKEALQIRRDPRSLGLGLAIPVLLLVLFGYALTLDVDNVPTVVWDRDNSQTAKDFILNFSNSRYFDVYAYADTYRDIVRRIDRGEALIGMVIPKDFSLAIESGARTPVQFLLDGSDANTATIARGYVTSVVNRYNEGLRARPPRAGGVVNPLPVIFRPRPWFNPNFESRIFIIPGLMVVIIMIIAALLTSLTVAREWERGTMEQLISTPVTPGELIAGKFIPYFCIGLFDLLVAVVLAVAVFGVPVRGSVLLLLALSSLFLAGALMMGILISVEAMNQRLASQLAMLTTFLPAFLLSGFVYPIWNMPAVIQAVTYLIPARYFIVILRGIYLKGVGLRDLWTQTLFLFIFAAAVSLLAVRRFRKKVA